MLISIDLENFKKYKGNTEGFIVLQLLYEKRLDVLKKYLGFIEEPIISISNSSLLNILEENEYIKITGEDLDSIYLLPKSKEVFNCKEVDFKEFWDKYHQICNIPKTDAAQAKIYFNRLNRHEKIAALNNIPQYYNSCVKNKDVRSGKIYVKKARTYLSDKNFNDEFDYKHDNVVEDDWTRQCI